MTAHSVTDVPVALEDPARRAEAYVLDALFQRTAGWVPVLWGRGPMGYGRYHYTYDSGREGTSSATGFSAHKSKFSLHIMPGYNAFPDIAARLGPRRRGKSCWYITRASKVDTDALSDLNCAGLADLRVQYPVGPT